MTCILCNYVGVTVIVVVVVVVVVVVTTVIFTSAPIDVHVGDRKVVVVEATNDKIHDSTNTHALNAPFIDFMIPSIYLQIASLLVGYLALSSFSSMISPCPDDHGIFCVPMSPCYHDDV